MICRRYGLSHQEVALRRDLIGLPRRKGRYPTLSEEQEAESWRAWCAALECGLVPGDEAALPAWAVELTESGGGSLAVIWATGE
jgi:hypothetical protein